MDKLLYYTGKAYFVQNEFDSALSFFQRVIGTYPKSKYAKKSTGMIGKTNAMIENRKKLTKPSPGEVK